MNRLSRTAVAAALVAVAGSASGVCAQQDQPIDLDAIARALAEQAGEAQLPVEHPKNSNALEPAPGQDAGSGRQGLPSWRFPADAAEFAEYVQAQQAHAGEPLSATDILARACSLYLGTGETQDHRPEEESAVCAHLAGK